VPQHVRGELGIQLGRCRIAHWPATGGTRPRSRAYSCHRRSCARRETRTALPSGGGVEVAKDVAEIAQAAGVHRTTVYDYLNKEG
jgi:hypothetical protein